MIHSANAGMTFDFYYIEDLSYSYLKILSEKGGLEGKTSIGLVGVCRDPMSSFSPESLYALLLPLTEERAERKRALYAQIEDKLGAIDSRERPDHENMDQDFDRDRYLEHMGISSSRLSFRYRTYCELFPEFGEMCKEYDDILPQPPSEPIVVLFSFPGLTKYDPCMMSKPYHEHHKKMMPPNPEESSLIRYRKGQVLERMPENAIILIPKTETHFTPQSLFCPSQE